MHHETCPSFFLAPQIDGGTSSHLLTDAPSVLVSRIVALLWATPQCTVTGLGWLVDSQFLLHFLGLAVTALFRLDGDTCVIPLVPSFGSPVSFSMAQCDMVVAVAPREFLMVRRCGRKCLS